MTWSQTLPFTAAYIERVRKADEIQTMRPPFETGDVIVSAARPEFRDNATGKMVPPTEERIQFIGEAALNQNRIPRLVYIDQDEPYIVGPWVPRLDQLLTLLGDAISYEVKVQSHAPFLLRNHLPGKALDWHEFALALLMADKYGKHWNGERWAG